MLCLAALDVKNTFFVSFRAACAFYDIYPPADVLGEIETWLKMGVCHLDMNALPNDDNDGKLFSAFGRTLRYGGLRLSFVNVTFYKPHMSKTVIYFLFL